ncbi:MAG: type 1 glutamine amidotransferase domain-containing protein [Robiginitomaculum sp.]|nr:type 1 glutamine amidotransferase domain-containing protein [Robiginitomaculum sp.]
MAKILMLLPNAEFDPTEAAVPWHVLSQAGHEVFFATGDGNQASCDQTTLSGKGLDGMLKSLAAKPENADIYRLMEKHENFQNPLAWQDVNPDDFDALVLPGGHAPGMKPYLESEHVFAVCRNFFARKAPVASICHGVLALARSKDEDGQSILHGYQVTGLNNFQENIAYKMTKKTMGTHYRTYPTSVQDEVSAVLASAKDFKPGSIYPAFGTAKNPNKGFIVTDRNLISARWPGDVYKLAHGFASMLRAL